MRTRYARSFVILGARASRTFQGSAVMSLYRLARAALACVGVLAAPAAARAADLKMIDTWPAANAVIDSHSDGFVVRFNQPVDHVNSSIFVRRGGQTVETLKPRLDSAPEVLFARAPTLPPG